MNCAEIKEVAALRASGELDRAASAAFDRHLQSCAACAREFQQDAALDESLRRASLADPIEMAALNERVHDAIVAEIAASHAGRPGLRRRVTTAALSLAAVVILGFFAYSQLVPPEDVLAAAIRDHEREVVDHGPRHWLRNPADMAELTAQSGLNTPSFASLAPAGYRLDRAKRCSLDGVDFVHLVFTDGTREFSLYLRPERALSAPRMWFHLGEERGIYTSDFGPEHLGCFEQGNLTAVVITNQSHDAAVALARTARSAL